MHCLYCLDEYCRITRSCNFRRLGAYSLYTVYSAGLLSRRFLESLLRLAHQRASVDIILNMLVQFLILCRSAKYDELCCV